MLRVLAILPCLVAMATCQKLYSAVYSPTVGSNLILQNNIQQRNAPSMYSSDRSAPVMISTQPSLIFNDGNYWDSSNNLLNTQRLRNVQMISDLEKMNQALKYRLQNIRSTSTIQGSQRLRIQVLTQRNKRLINLLQQLNQRKLSSIPTQNYQSLSRLLQLINQRQQNGYQLVNRQAVVRQQRINQLLQKRQAVSQSQRIIRQLQQRQLVNQQAAYRAQLLRQQLYNRQLLNQQPMSQLQLITNANPSPARILSATNPVQGVLNQPSNDGAARMAQLMKDIEAGIYDQFIAQNSNLVN